MGGLLMLATFVAIISCFLTSFLLTIGKRKDSDACKFLGAASFFTAIINISAVFIIVLI